MEPTLTFIAALAASVIGGSGVAGLVAGTTELGRRTRLRRRAEKAIDLRDRLAEGSPGRLALEHAISADVARLAALSVVGVGSRFDRHRNLFLGGAWVLACGVALVLLSYPPDFETQFLPIPSVIALGVVASIAGGAVPLVLKYGPNAKRRSYVRGILNGKQSRQAVRDFPN